MQYKQTNLQNKISHLFRTHNGNITKRIVFIRTLMSFSPGTPVFLSFSKTNIFKFQFNQESGRRRTTLWMCYPQIFIYLFIYLFTANEVHQDERLGVLLILVEQVSCRTR